MPAYMLVIVVGVIGVCALQELSKLMEIEVGVASSSGKQTGRMVGAVLSSTSTPMGALAGVASPSGNQTGRLAETVLQTTIDVCV